MGLLFDRQLLLVSGKGGVGKTTVAASLALAASARGARVLALELSYELETTTPLGTMLQVTKNSVDEPIVVDKNLSFLLVTPTSGHTQFLRDELPIRLLAEAAMRAAAIRRFLTAAPTLAEMGMLYRILELADRKDANGKPLYDHVIVDLPATGHALALAQVPRAILRVVKAGPIRGAVERGIALLENPARTSGIVVSLPEALPVSEAKELVQSVRVQGIPVTHVILNRFPHDPFGEGEFEAATAIAERHAPLLGSRWLPRIEGARKARARLLDVEGIDVLVLPENATTKELSQVLAGAAQ